MTITNYPDHLNTVLTKRMGNQKASDRVNFGMTNCLLMLSLKINNVTPFLKINQAELCDDLYEEHYIDHSRLRALQMHVFYRIGVQIACNFFNCSKKIIELGAGDVDEQGKTFGMSLLPERCDVNPTDFNGKVVARNQKRNPKYSLLDMNRLQETKESQFLACNVIDTLTSEKLSSFIHAFEALPIGSTFVHLNDICPMINAFAWDLISQNYLVFPHQMYGELKGALVIDYKKARDELIHNLDVMEINFLDEAACSPERNEQVFNHLLQNGGAAIGEWLKKAIPSVHLKEVPIIEHFEAKLRAISSPGLTTLFCNTLFDSTIIDRRAIDEKSLKHFNNCNWLHNDKGTLVNRTCYVLNPGKVMISANLIVLAIRKVGI